MILLVKFCPMHEKLEDLKKKYGDSGRIAWLPKTCLSCRALNSTVTAEIEAAREVKVRVIPPGASALNMQESVYNPHRLKKFKANRAKNQPP